MSYLGNTPTTQNFISGTDYFNGTGSQTAFTLSRTVNSVNDIQVVVNNVVQQPNDAYTLSGTTLTMTSAPSAGTNNVYVRYLSTTTQVITPSQNTVSWNTLDTNTQNDLGLMYKNKIINGNMAIDQRNAGASVTASDGYVTLDRFYYFGSQASKFTIGQNLGSVTPPSGFRNYLGLSVSATASVGASDYFFIGQKIEGFNVADFNLGTASAVTFTLSFWVRSSLTGTFGGSLRNGAQNRSYPFSYTISAANTWEQKSVTIAGDTSGTWLTTNGSGLELSFSLGTGSTLSGTAGSWSGSNFISATGATSVVGTNGATFYLTGVQLEVGTQATAFSTAGGSYGAELALCQRYFYRLNRTTGGDNTVATGANSAAHNLFVIKMPTELRAKPTITRTGTAFTVYSAGVNTVNPTFASSTAGTQQSRIIFTLTGTSGNSCWMDLDNDNTYFDFSSEL